MSKTTNKPIIAVDVDDVLGDQVGTILRYLRDKKGADLTFEQYSENWGEMCGISEEAAVAEFIEFALSDYGFGNFEMIPGGREVLQKLKPDFELVVLTSRNLFLRKDTLSWINKNFPDIFDEIYFSGIYDNDEKLHVKANRTKADKLREIGATYLIDDQPKHTNAAANIGIKSLLFGDFGWNRNAEIVDGVTRVNNWGGVADYFGVE